MDPVSGCRARDTFAMPYQNCKKLEAISSSSSSRVVSSSSSLGCLVPLAGLIVIFGAAEDLEEGTERGALTGTLLTIEVEGERRVT